MKNYRQIVIAIIACLGYLPAYARIGEKTALSKPLSFIENIGQITDQYNKPRKDIDVKLESPGMSVFVGDAAIHYQWYKVNPKSRNPNSNSTGFAPIAGQPEPGPARVETYRMDVELVGANKHAGLVLEEPQEYYETYYLPYQTNGLTALSYSRITYKNVYPGIDWVIYNKDNELKYDFVVHAGADAALIKLQYSGATELKLADGALLATTPYGSITEAAPYTYDAETKSPIASAYKLTGNTLSFELPSHTTANGLVIDPSLSWGTYYGGSSDEDYGRIATDRAGNVYLSSTTKSSSNIATVGAFQTVINATINGFVAKLNIGGVRQWATYYGEVFPDAVACDKNNDVYVAGSAGVAGLATTGAHQTSTSGSDGFLLKLSTTGQRLWATYYGGSGVEVLETVFCDTGGVYIGGSTGSASGIATPGSHQATHSGTTTIGLIARFNSAGVRQWGSYYPGFVNSITGFGDSVLYIAGSTELNSGLSTIGAHQGSYGGGTEDGFVAKFTTAGVRNWGTYYGGSEPDRMFSAATDRAGNLYLAGASRSASNIATAGAFKPSKLYGATIYEGMLVKFNSAGSRLWGTYDVTPEIISVCTDSSGIIYTGTIMYGGGFATTGAYQTSFGGAADGFLSFFSPAGDRLYATYYGGLSSDNGYSVAYGGNRVYLAGRTSSTNAIATSGAHQTSYGGGGNDAFLAQFIPDAHVFLKDIGAITQLCKGDSLLIRYGVTQPFISGNVFTVQLSNASGSFASPTTLGTKTGTQADSFKVYVPFTVANGSGYRLRILGSLLPDTSLDLGVNINISNYPGIPVATVNNPVCTGDSLKLSVGAQTGVNWSWTGPNSFTANVQNPGIANVTTAAAGDYIVIADFGGCMRRDTVNVTVGTTPAKPIAANNTPICAGLTLNLTSSSSTPGVSYSWSGPMSYSSTQQNPNITAATPGHAGDYVVTATLGNCHAKDTTTAVINSVSSLGAYASPNDSFCEGTLVSVVAVPFNGGTSPTFQWYKNGTQIPGATGLVYSTSAVVTGDSFYCRMIATGICTDPLELYSPGIKITVLPITSKPSVTISSNPSLPQPGQPVAFTAVAVNGGPTPTFQWLRNGHHVIGATSAIWNASNLHPYDQISCIVFSSDVCANPKTDTSSMIVVNFPTAVNDIDGSMFKVYPNPATNELTIEGEAGMQVTMLNVLGQEVYSGVLNSTKEVINISQLAAGHYVLQLVGADGSRSVVKVEKE